MLLPGGVLVLGKGAALSAAGADAGLPAHEIARAITGLLSPDRRVA